MPSTRAPRIRARMRNGRRLITPTRNKPANVQRVIRLIRKIHVQPAKKPFSVMVKQFHNQTSNRSWVVLDFIDNVSGKKRSFQVTTAVYNAWRTKYKKSGKKGSLVSAMAANMAAHPDIFKSLAQIGGDTAKNMIPALFDVI